MQNTEIVIEVNQKNLEIRTSVERIIAIKKEIKVCKEFIKAQKEYNKSGFLEDAENKKKALNKVIKEEKEKIEKDLLEDEDYKKTVSKELLLKNELKTETHKLKQIAGNNKDNQLSIFDYNIDDTYIKVGVMPTAKIYINGKEEK